MGIELNTIPRCAIVNFLVEYIDLRFAKILIMEIANPMMEHINPKNKKLGRKQLKVASIPKKRERLADNL